MSIKFNITAIGGPRRFQESPLDLAVSGVNTICQLVPSLFLRSLTAHINTQQCTPDALRRVTRLGMRGHELGSDIILTYSQQIKTPQTKLVISGYFGFDFNLAQAVSGTEQFISIPVIVKGSLGFGNHIVHIFVDRSTTPVEIEFFDSHGLDVAHQNNDAALTIVQQLVAHFSTSTVIEHSQVRQQGGNTCGLWVLWHLEQRLLGLSAEEIARLVADIEVFRLQVAAKLAEQ